jgi:hypothetical protein
MLILLIDNLSEYAMTFQVWTGVGIIFGLKALRHYRRG